MAVDTRPDAQPRKRRHWTRIIVIAVVGVVVLAVGGTLLYTKVINKQPAALKISTTDTSGTSAVPIEGTWKAAAGSQAGYRVKEVLLGQDTEAVGRTSEVTGTMTVAGTSVTAATFTVDMASVKSNEGQRDNQFRGRIMDVAKYPTSSFTLTQPIALGSVPAAGKQISVNGVGKLTLRGFAKDVTVPMTAVRSGDKITVLTTIPVKFSDYQIANPSFGPIKTQDNGVVEIKMTFVKS